MGADDGTATNGSDGAGGAAGTSKPSTDADALRAGQRDIATAEPDAVRGVLEESGLATSTPRPAPGPTRCRGTREIGVVRADRRWIVVSC